MGGGLVPVSRLSDRFWHQTLVLEGGMRLARQTLLRHGTGMPKAECRDAPRTGPPQ